MNRMNHKLCAVITNVRNVADQVAQGSSEIHATSLTLSENASEQAANAEKSLLPWNR